MMRHNWIIYLLIILMIGVLMGCQPTTSTEPENQPVLDNNDEVETQIEAEGDEGVETAVPQTDTSDQPNQDSSQSAPEPEESDPDIISLPAPEATTDRNIRLTPGALPAGVEIAPIIVQEPGTIEPIPDNLLALVTGEMQANAGLSPENYEIIRAEATTWNDGSLGCPQPGMMYTQALVDGYWIVVQAGEETFDYRVAATGFIVRCEQTLRP
ncbi:MAG: hypothetical protein GY943_06935 [Chloroflexi bacterium]|nr:hypothetical protein [Chloroflexota bacterium]